MPFSWDVLIAYLFGLAMLFFFARLLLAPLRLVVRLLVSGVIGGVLLYLTNILGSYWDFHLPINPITALVAGFLGIPGIILLLLLKVLLVPQ